MLQHKVHEVVEISLRNSETVEMCRECMANCGMK